MNNYRLKSIDALRGLSFLFIFLCHAGLKYFGSFGALGTSIFLVLSGFVTSYSYHCKCNNYECFTVDINKMLHKKIYKLYPLHIFLTIMMFVFEIMGIVKMPTILAIFSLVSNILLFQEWIPLYKRSLNGTSWFLCPILLEPFAFKLYVKYTDANITNKKIFIRIALLILAQITLCLIGSILPIFISKSSIIYENDITKWFVYYCPPIRLIEICIGFNIGTFFTKNRDNGLNSNSFIIYELLSIMLTAASLIIYNKAPSFMNYSERSRWWIYSLLFLPSSISIVLLFAYNKGYISKKITNPFFLYLAKISPYAFLIHSVFNIYISKIFEIFSILSKYDLSIILPLVKILCGGVITIIASELYIKLVNNYIKE